MSATVKKSHLKYYDMAILFGPQLLAIGHITHILER